LETPTNSESPSLKNFPGFLYRGFRPQSPRVTTIDGSAGPACSCGLPCNTRHPCCISSPLLLRCTFVSGPSLKGTSLFYDCAPIAPRRNLPSNHARTRDQIGNFRLTCKESKLLHCPSFLIAVFCFPRNFSFCLFVFTFTLEVRVFRVLRVPLPAGVASPQPKLQDAFRACLLPLDVIL